MLHRCGGRIQTIDLGQGYVELGASVVHGSNQANAVFNLASSYDLVESMTTSAGVGTILHSSGIAVDQSIAGELLFHLNATQFKLHKRNASNFVTLGWLVKFFKIFYIFLFRPADREQGERIEVDLSR